MSCLKHFLEEYVCDTNSNMTDEYVAEHYNIDVEYIQLWRFCYTHNLTVEEELKLFEEYWRKQDV